MEIFLNAHYKLLKSGGKLIVSLWNAYSNLTPYFVGPRWFCDWNFMLRDKEVLRSFIVKRIKPRKLRIITKPLECIFFVVLEK